LVDVVVADGEPGGRPFPGIADTAEIGRILADRRGWLFFDLDDEIDGTSGLPSSGSRTAAIDAGLGRS
jgi:hypothetical protein